MHKSLQTAVLYDRDRRATSIFGLNISSPDQQPIPSPTLSCSCWLISAMKHFPLIAQFAGGGIRARQVSPPGQCATATGSAGLGQRQGLWRGINPVPTISFKGMSFPNEGAENWVPPKTPAELSKGARGNFWKCLRAVRCLRSRMFSSDEGL